LETHLFNQDKIQPHINRFLGTLLSTEGNIQDIDISLDEEINTRNVWRLQTSTKAPDPAIFLQFAPTCQKFQQKILDLSHDPDQQQNQIGLLTTQQSL